ncbi:hypothetical protein hbim_01461 [Mycolicibacterium mageritense]|uniref:Uncharacterized protein n=1 Tax=Mycolicibacterium mageritense TaxID=53462 RepID=A0AAI8XM69_MYCME|nr:hypothetical protein hbim_01461 [Mycolicibacterium mageritense]
MSEPLDVFEQAVAGEPLAVFVLDLYSGRNPTPDDEWITL